MAIRVLVPSDAEGGNVGPGLIDRLRAFRAELALELLPAGAGRARLARLDRELVALASTVDPAAAIGRELAILHDVLTSHLDAVEGSQLEAWSEHRSHHLLERARQSVLAGVDHVLGQLTGSR